MSKVHVRIGRDKSEQQTLQLVGTPTVSNVVIMQSEGSMANKLKFELKNCSPSLANMLRRVFVSEVPTMAFDRIFVNANEGVVLDELLSHRIGLCPVVAPVAHFEYITGDVTLDDKASLAKKALLFELDVVAPKNQRVTTVYSRHLKFVPLPGQQSLQGVCIAHDDIPLAKLGPGQRISLKAYAVKGLGCAHAKWSPTSACWYEFAPSIQLGVLSSDEAAQLVSICPKAVFDLEDTSAVVSREESCSLCRECLQPRYSFHEKVQISKTSDRILFIVESVGQMSSVDIVEVGLKMFSSRCKNLQGLVTTAAPVVLEK